MNMLSSILRTLLAVSILVSIAAGSDYQYPVMGEVDLSSSFCEFRPLHFHGGIDIRTGGEIGRKLYSPVNGYVWRLKYSYTGYGKAVYIKDNEGFIYVFGHLSALNSNLEKTVKNIQLNKKSYCFDKEFGPGEIPLSKGELFAFSGQTGYGAPHIHFEKRTPGNKPINPLTNGFAVSDNMAPEFRSLGFVYSDSLSIFENGNKRIYKEVSYSSKSNSYFYDEILFFKAPFGIMIDAGDRIRRNGMRLNLYRARLYIDDYLYYEVNYENYDYEQTAMVDLSFDYHNTVAHNAYWHTLFNPTGKDYDGAVSHYDDGGIYSPATQNGYGLHRARIEIFDAAGNSSELSFEFFYHPHQSVYELNESSDSTLQLLKKVGGKLIKVDRIECYLSGRKGWSRIDNRRISGDAENYKVNLNGLRIGNKMARIDLIGSAGWKLTDHYISFYEDKTPEYSLSHELIDGGIIFSVVSSRKGGPAPAIHINYEDGYIAEIDCSATSYNKYSAFYTDHRIRSSIVGYDLIEKTTGFTLKSVSTEIFPVGNDPDPIRIKNAGFEVNVSADCVYSDTYFELKQVKGKYPFPKNRVGEIYELSPKTIPLAKAVTVSFELDPEIEKNNLGVYKLNKKNKWVWLKSKIDGNKISARSSLTGTFAVLADRAAPKIRKIYPPDGKSVFRSDPKISCTITDGLSELNKCGDIEVTLDGRWQIPEYDFEIDRLFVKPDRPLEKGRHELTIKAVDKAGNEKIVKTHFYVSEKK